MKTTAAKLAASLALAIIAGCATHPVPIPSFLAHAFAQKGIDTAASIRYQDELGHPINEHEFASRFGQSKSFVITQEGKRHMPDVTLRLRARSTQPAADSGQRLPTGAAVADFRTCAAPAYPISELRARHTGTVTLNFLISVDGYVKKAEIAETSGFPGLDQAAMVALVRCRFKPAVAAGLPVERWSPVQYKWSID